MSLITPNFNDTEVAFKRMTNAELKRAFWLFKIISFPWLVKIGQKLLAAALFLRLPVKKLVKATIFRQFIGGENLEECKHKVAVLFNDCKVGSILDYAAEGNEGEPYFDKCKDRVIETIKLATKNDGIPFSVFKVTGIARFALLEKIQLKGEISEDEKLEWQKVKQRANEICQAANEAKTPVFIDAEESWIQDAIDELAEELMLKYNSEFPLVCNTVQMYRKDRLGYLKVAHEKAVQKGYLLGLKIVRGAYMEKERERALKMNYPSPIHENKYQTDIHYNEALKYVIQHYQSIAFCAGTHNEESCLLLVKLMQENNFPPNFHRIFFAQLLGMSDHISFNLVSNKYNVAKYVPFGPVKKVIPYLIRRANENTSIQGQTGRELNLIQQELNRRKSI